MEQPRLRICQVNSKKSAENVTFTVFQGVKGYQKEPCLAKKWLMDSTMQIHISNVKIREIITKIIGPHE